MHVLRQWIGVELDEVSPLERFVSALGAGTSLLVIVLISHHALGLDGAPMIIASMGASAVLLFGVPHGQLSQPWPVLAGHVGAAVIGVTCARLIANTELAAALAVALTVAAMHQFKFIHPPGGATALTAVIGGPAVKKTCSACTVCCPTKSDVTGLHRRPLSHRRRQIIETFNVENESVAS